LSVAQPLVIGLLALPILVQVYSNAGFTYLLDRARRRVVCRRSFGADRRERFFERAVAELCREFLSGISLGYDRRQQSWRTSAMIDFKGSHFERDVILWGVRWYVAYPMSYRQLEEMMEERGVEVDHSTLNRWVVKYAPLLDKQFRAGKRAVGSSWRLDETSHEAVTVNG
jgi:hypothetical protein